LFTGQRWDPPLLFAYTRHRCYHAKLGRFLQIDPEPDQVNPYQYCMSRPIVCTDPFGLRPWSNGSINVLGWRRWTPAYWEFDDPNPVPKIINTGNGNVLITHDWSNYAWGNWQKSTLNRENELTVRIGKYRWTCVWKERAWFQVYAKGNASLAIRTSARVSPTVVGKLNATMKYLPALPRAQLLRKALSDVKPELFAQIQASTRILRSKIIWRESHMIYFWRMDSAAACTCTKSATTYSFPLGLRIRHRDSGWVAYPDGTSRKFFGETSLRGVLEGRQCIRSIVVTGKDSRELMKKIKGAYWFEGDPRVPNSIRVWFRQPCPISLLEHLPPYRP